MVIAVYPGTFDPLTRGHEDLVRRAAGLFSKLVVGVADSRNKKPFFVLDERIAIAREVLSHYPNVEVAGFRGLLKDFVRDQNARVIVRPGHLKRLVSALAENLGRYEQRFGAVTVTGIVADFMRRSFRRRPGGRR